MSNPCILIVEDDNNISSFISEVLITYDYIALTANTAREAIETAEIRKPDLILLDLGLPDMDGTEVIRSVRRTSSVPIIVLSSRDSGQDKVNALDLGADDYMTKPFETQEFLARIRTALRRQNRDLEKARRSVYKSGELFIDYSKRLVTRSGEIIHLTQNEYKIVTLLSKNAGMVISHNDIIEKIWGSNVSGDNKILRVNITNIRKKLEVNPAEPKFILTVSGIGYRMAEADNSNN